MQAMSPAEELAAIADVARAKGLTAVKVTNGGAGREFSFSVGPLPAQPGEAKKEDGASRAQQAWGRKKARLKRELGREPTDDEVENLP
jgi:hypothetical protein